MKKLVYILVAMMVFVSCTETGDEKLSFQVGDEITLSPNVTYYASNADISIKIIQVNDSRCPINAMCIWAGEARVKMEVSKNKQTETLEISTWQPQQITWNSYTFQIKEVSPYPGSEKDTDLSDYKIKLLVTQE